MACTHKYKHKHTKLNWCHASIGTRTGSFKIVTVFLILYGIVSPHVMNSGIRQIFAFGIRNPLKFCPRNRNLGFGIPLKMEIRNPSSTDIDLESLPGIRKEFLAWNPESKTVLGSFTWDDWSFHTWPVRCKHLSLSPGNKNSASPSIVLPLPKICPNEPAYFIRFMFCGRANILVLVLLNSGYLHCNLRSLCSSS